MDTANRLKWTLLATLGWSAAACGGVAAEGPESPGSGGDGMATGGTALGASGGGGSGGRSGSGGSRAAGGASTGGAATGGAATGGTEMGGASAVLCTNPSRLVASGKETGFIGCDEGYRHRAAAVVCDNNVDPAVGPSAQPSVFDECQVNSDCGGPKDHCVYSPGGEALPVKNCERGCTEDADCGAGYVCECGELVGRCIPSNCTTDEDCGAGQLCLTDDYPSCGAVEKLGCTRPDDACRSQADCDGGCQLVDGARQCAGLAVCGRPFLVQGEHRTAAVEGGARFSECVVGVETSDLSGDERQIISEHFVRAGQMEHASIAAFARFTLQLLALGAPASLVVEATRAQLDEARHAELCFALAREYGGRDLCPGGLSLSEALEEATVEEVARLCFFEGCVGECTAALEAAEAARTAKDPRLAAALSAIAEDELRHAALAYRFVAWALEKQPDLRGRVVSWLSQHARAVNVRGERGESEWEALRSYGVLSPKDLDQIARDAHDKLIQPCVRALLAGAPLEVPRVAIETSLYA